MSDNLQPYGTQDTAPPSEPLTREEQYLSAIAGVTAATDIPEKPLTRAEKYLNKIVENGGGGGGGGGGGFTPTAEQLAAMNSGITAEKLQEDENDILNIGTKIQGIDSTGDDFIEINGKKLYFSTTTPSNPSDGDWWLN